MWRLDFDVRIPNPVRPAQSRQKRSIGDIVPINPHWAPPPRRISGSVASVTRASISERIKFLHWAISRFAEQALDPTATPLAQC